MYINRTIKCLRSCACKFASLQVILDFFFFYFSKKMGPLGDGKRNTLLGWPNRNSFSIENLVKLFIWILIWITHINNIIVDYYFV